MLLLAFVGTSEWADVPTTLNQIFAIKPTNIINISAAQEAAVVCVPKHDLCLSAPFLARLRQQFGVIVLQLLR